MNQYLDRRATIQKAASLVRGDRLSELYRICDEQKTISTRKLSRIVDQLAKSDRLDALHFKALADQFLE